MLKISPEISIITYIEILSKKDIPEQDNLKYINFCKVSVVYSEIGVLIAEHAIRLRKKYGLKTPDAIIAATALAYGLILISRNEKDFNKIHKLEIVNPWKV